MKNVQRIPTKSHSKSLGIFDVSLEMPSDSIGFMGDSVSVGEFVHYKSTIIFRVAWYFQTDIQTLPVGLHEDFCRTSVNTS